MRILAIDDSPPALDVLTNVTIFVQEKEYRGHVYIGNEFIRGHERRRGSGNILN